MNLPKIDPKQREHIVHARGTPAMRELTRYLQARLDYMKSALIRADPLEVPRLQGRAAELEDLISTMTKDTP